MKKPVLVNIIIFCFHFYCCSQTAIIDSIKQQLRQPALSSEQRLSTLLDLCDQFSSLHPDSMALYVAQAKMLSAKSLSSKNKALCNYFDAIVLRKQGKIDAALSIVQKGLSDKTIMAMPAVKFKYYRSITGLLVRNNQLKEALQNGFEALEMWEKLNDLQGQVDAITGIGWVYMELNQNNDAIKWFLKGLALYSKMQTRNAPTVVYSNIAAVYNNLKKNDSASFYINKAIAGAIQDQNLTFLCNAYYIYSDVCIDSGNFKKAELYLKKGVEIRKTIGDPFYIVSDIAQLGKFYTNTKQYQLCNDVVQEGLKIAQQYHLDAKLLFLNTILAENYKASGNYVQYSNILNTIVQLKDTLYDKNSAAAVGALQTKYEVEKKENTIIRQQLDLVTKNYWLYGSIVVSLFGALAFYLLFKNYRKKEKLKMAILLEEEKRFAVVSIKEAQENERKRIAADLHDNLGAYAAAISSNIDYLAFAKVSDSDQQNIADLKSNAQAIVAQLNDTIWVLTKDELALTAVSDRLKVFIQRLPNNYAAVQIDVIEKIEKDHLLQPMQAFHLFKILQEGITNALKHSNCQKISVSIESDATWQIVIEDDGNGLIDNQVEKYNGNGLQNMKNRSLEAGWLISWEQIVPKGTKVTIAGTTN